MVDRPVQPEDLETYVIAAIDEMTSDQMLACLMLASHAALQLETDEDHATDDGATSDAWRGVSSAEPELIRGLIKICCRSIMGVEGSDAEAIVWLAGIEADMKKKNRGNGDGK